MSYDLAVWEGERPRSDEEAARQFERLTDRLEAEDADPPSPAIEAFVGELVERWPDDDEHLEDSPWAAAPLIGEAMGDFVYFAMQYSAADDVSGQVAEIAQRHGLVCFDPQLETLRPPAERPRRLFDAFRR